MTDIEQPTKHHKFKIWHYFPIVIILLLAGYFLYPQIALLTRSWYVVKSMLFWAVLLAAAAETVSWIGNGIIFHYIIKANGRELSIFKGALIAVGTLAISLVAGGAVGLAVSYGWLNRESKDGKAAFLAATLPAFFNTGTIMGVSIIGVIYLFLAQDLTKGQLFEFGTALLFLLVIAVLTFVALGSEALVKRVGVWVLGWWARIRQQSFYADEVIDEIDKFFSALKSMGNGKWAFALFGAVVNVGFDMLAMFFLFIAAGNPISAETLFAGYGLPLVLAKVAFIFPGGIGVIEGSMKIIFESLGVPSAIGVVVVMGYRLLSFWIPTILGFAAAAYLSGRFIRLRKKA